MMINPCLTRRHSPSGDSHQARKVTAETEESNTENLKESVWNCNQPEVEDWIEKERRIELQYVQQAAKQPGCQGTRFKLPPSNYSNKWTPNFPLVYHQYPPQSNNQLINYKQDNQKDHIQPENSHLWGKSIDTEFSNILIEDEPSKCYYSPVPYGFDANRSRIIVGDRTLINFVDCSFKEFVTRFNDLQKSKNSQFKGIKVTCIRDSSK